MTTTEHYAHLMHAAIKYPHSLLVSQTNSSELNSLAKHELASTVMFVKYQTLLNFENISFVMENVH